jgi:hypothetical protein
LYTGDSGRVEEGRWTGDSVDRHPDLAWLPTHNPLGPDHRENHRVEYGKVLEILHADHERSEPELVPRRESDERDP